MKKTFYYKFLPTKAGEEEAASKLSRSTLLHHLDDPVLTEIRDWHPPPPAGTWIEKVFQVNNFTTGKLFFSHRETFEHVFRHWTFDMAQHVVSGNKLHVTIMDITDGNNPLTHHGENLFFERGPAHRHGHDHHDYSYALGCKDLVEKQKLFRLGDELGLRWNAEFGLFQLKIIKNRAGSLNIDDQVGNINANWYDEDQICLRI